MQSPAEDQTASLLTPVGYMNQYCGYCRNDTESRSYYARTESLSVEHYQSLIDRGWRRSGTLLYKPHMSRSCCPHYTIRLDATELKPSKDQRQAVNRWNKHVLGDRYIAEAAKLYPRSKKEKARSKTEFDLIGAVHNAEYASLKTPPESEHKFEVTLEPSGFTEEKFQLFREYQQTVHKESKSEASREGFKRFLCTSPLRCHTRKDGEREKKLGSYHQCYRLDGRLVAIGVLDLLPHCVSAVYFIYPEDMNRWNFGKIGALSEAALAVEGGYKYYYMGYYIHSCIKMRYKGDYHPQYILDPQTYVWHPLDGEFRKRLDANKYVTLTQYAEDPQHPSVSTHTPTAREEPYPDVGKPTDPVSLFEVDMPGIPTISELLSQINLNEVKVRVGKRNARTKDLIAWDESDTITDPNSLKASIAELIAAVGPELGRQIWIHFPVR